MLDTRSGDKQLRVQLPGPNVRMAWSEQQAVIAVCSRVNAVTFVASASMKVLKTHAFDSASPVNEVSNRVLPPLTMPQQAACMERTKGMARGSSAVMRTKDCAPASPGGL